MKRKRSVLMLTGLLLAIGIAGGNAAFEIHANADEAHWPQWRGPFLTGVARGAAPIEFSDTKNIKWKTEVPGRGHSTPIIWGDRLFLTTAVSGAAAQPDAGQPRAGRNPAGGGGSGLEHRFVVMCFDRKTGKVLWQKTAKTTVPETGYHRTYGSFASNSPTTDGKYLYVSFGSYGIYCYDFNGKLIWEKDLGVKMQMRNDFGEGVAPVIYGNSLIQTFDQEVNSFVVVLDKRTGKELWRKTRDEISAWATPLVIEHKGKKQTIISATKKVRSYDLDSGELIWECAGLGANVIPAPVSQGDVVYVMSGFRDPKLMAIKLGREGDLTGSDAILWSQTRGLSYTPSPVLHENKYYALTDNGLLSCFDANTGKVFYQQSRVGQADSFKASPIAADGKLYTASETGAVTVVKMGETFEILATNRFEDQIFISSPIVAEGNLYLRSQKYLFCVGQ